MRSITLVALGAGLAVGGFCAGAWVGATQLSSDSSSSLKIRNASGARLERLALHVETGGLRSDTELPPLGIGEDAIVRFHVAGEGGASLRVTLADGRVVESETYVESGDAHAASVGAAGIAWK